VKRAVSSYISGLLHLLVVEPEIDPNGGVANVPRCHPKGGVAQLAQTSRRFTKCHGTSMALIGTWHLCEHILFRVLFFDRPGFHQLFQRPVKRPLAQLGVSDERIF
jgi:hypothetical protein